jgi:hypothetical protein
LNFNNTASNPTSTYTPKNVGTGLLAWFDGKDIAGSGAVGTAGNSVATWVNKGSGGNGSGINSPTYVAGGGVKLNGTTQYFTTNIPYRKTHTIFLVATPVAAGTGAYYTSTTPLANTGTTILGGAAEDLTLFPYGGTAQIVITASQPTTPFLVGVTKTLGVNVAAYYNGLQSFSNADNINVESATSWGYIGSANGTVNMVNGTIYEYIVYSSALSTLDRQRVEGHQTLIRQMLLKNLPQLVRIQTISKLVQPTVSIYLQKILHSVP